MLSGGMNPASETRMPRKLVAKVCGIAGSEMLENPSMGGHCATVGAEGS